MDAEEQTYKEIAGSLPDAVQSQMFGKPCFKIRGKAFVAYFQQCMVFKLSGEEHQEALSLEDATLFDPSGKNRPMKEWVQLPYKHQARWVHFARAAFDYVSAGQ